ncbi:MAG: helix-turn-helix domain-containing protein [Eubacterium sp.]|nr:helix-turn-helix domain-containing protein [Eubacterium sp.]
MDKEQKLKNSIKELQMITGLPLTVEMDGEKDTDDLIQGVQTLCSAYRDAYDKDAILRRWLTGEMSDDDFFPFADRLHIGREESRAVFLVSFKNEVYPEIITVLKQIFPDNKTQVLPKGKNHLIILYHHPARKAADLKKVVYEILNTLNAELMEEARISYGDLCSRLDQLPRSYQKSEYAMKVGNVFYPDRTVYHYDELGVGSLLYGLPKDICIEYIRSNLGENYPDQETTVFQSDILQTANCFIRNDLNIAETSRQLHIHRNTLLYRLEQIQNETGLDIRRFDAAMTYKLCSMILLYLNQV